MNWIDLAKSLSIWDNLQEEFTKEYLQLTLSIVKKRRSMGNVYPEGKDMFRALKETPYDKVKCVILGQDPYYTPGTADGLAFSSRLDVPYSQLSDRIPSLFQMLEHLDDCYPNFFPPKIDCDLSDWAKEGVLLLNTILTVEENQPLSHQKLGWQQFTKEVINKVSEKENVVWLLFGSYAQSYEPLCKGFVIKTEHPAFATRQNRKWDGKLCFLKANEFLKSKNISEINWL